MLHDYKAVSAGGKVVRGRIDAANEADLEARLRRIGLDLIQAKASGQMPGLGRVPRRELIHFCFQLHQCLQAGIPLLDSLADLRDSGDHPRFRQIIAGLAGSIEGGQSLSGALAAYPHAFNQVFSSLVHAGEASGCLPEVLASLYESLKWEDELAAQTRRLLLYPAFVGGTILAATLFLMLYMVPQLRGFLKNMGQTLPAHTRALFLVSDFLGAYWHLLLALVPAGIFLFHQALRRNPALREAANGWLLRLPIIGDILRKIVLSRFAEVFAMLYASGIPILDAIRTTREAVGNRAIEAALRNTEQAIGDGRQVSAAFQDAGMFPPLVIRMLRMGENTGALDQALRNVGYFYSRDVKEAAAKAQTLIEPALTLLLGLLLGWIMLSLLGPIYGVISGVRL